MDHPKRQGYPVHIGHMGDPGQENLKSPGRWGGQLEEMLSLAHERAVTVRSNVSSPQAPRLEAGPASTSGSTSGSGYTTSAETVHYNPLASSKRQCYPAGGGQCSSGCTIEVHPTGRVTARGHDARHGSARQAIRTWVSNWTGRKSNRVQYNRSTHFANSTGPICAECTRQ
jgi:hypothetical protein